MSFMGHFFYVQNVKKLRRQLRCWFFDMASKIDSQTELFFTAAI